MPKFRVIRDDYLGTDINSTEFFKFALREDKQTYKISEYKEVTFTMLANTGSVSESISHSLGYIPVVSPTIKHGSNGYPYMGVLNPTIEVPAFGGGTTFIFFFISWDHTTISIDGYTDSFTTNANNETFTVEVNIMLDEQ